MRSSTWSSELNHEFLTLLYIRNPLSIEAPVLIEIPPDIHGYRGFISGQERYDDLLPDTFFNIYFNRNLLNRDARSLER